MTLETITAQVRNCYNCDLRKTCAAPVPGSGPLTASVMVVGEGPGAEEDQQGIPFSGPSGRMLRTLMTSAGIEPYYTNTVKCRPPNNRDPLQSEVNACNHHLNAEIQAINPRVIVTIGRVAMRQFLPDDSIMKVHGKPHIVHNRVVLPIIHTAAALRRPELIPVIANDIRLIARLLDTPLESSKARLTVL